MFLFAVPAGALADIIDKRRFLIAVELGIMLVSAVFAAMVTFRFVTPVSLLAFMFVISLGSALTAPAWQSIVPLLVPRRDLGAAVAANSVGINISRAIGPALSGVITGAFGIAAPFWLDAFSNAGTIGGLVWWRGPKREAQRLPAERLAGAIRTGIRYARNNPPLRATLYRAVAFFLFASAYWALLPLVAHSQIGGGASVYGLLLGAIGVGAVGGASVLPRLKAALGPDRIVLAGTVTTALALVLYGIARDAATAIVASLLAGVAWIAALSSLNVSAQLALPEWVRGRGFAIYVTVMFRRANARQRGMGRACRRNQPADRALPRRSRRAAGHSVDMALQAAGRGQPRSHAVHALAHTRDGRRPREARGPRDGDRGVSDRHQTPPRLPCCHRSYVRRSDDGTAPTPGAFSRTRLNPGDSWKRSWSNRGSSTCGSTCA